MGRHVVSCFAPIENLSHLFAVNAKSGPNCSEETLLRSCAGKLGDRSGHPLGFLIRPTQQIIGTHP